MATLLQHLSGIWKCIGDHPEVINQEVFVRYPDPDADEGYTDVQCVVKLDGYCVYIEPVDLDDSLKSCEPTVWPHSKDYAVRRNT